MQTSALPPLPHARTRSHTKRMVLPIDSLPLVLCRVLYACRQVHLAGAEKTGTRFFLGVHFFLRILSLHSEFCLFSQNSNKKVWRHVPTVNLGFKRLFQCFGASQKKPFHQHRSIHRLPLIERIHPRPCLFLHIYNQIALSAFVVVTATLSATSRIEPILCMTLKMI